MSMLIFAYQCYNLYRSNLFEFSCPRGFLVRDVASYQWQGMVTVYSQHAITASIQLDNLDIQHSETSVHEGAACGGPTNTSMHAHMMVPPTSESSYISASTVSDDPSNADTRNPSEQATDDPCLHQQLRWLRYLEWRSMHIGGSHS